MINPTDADIGLRVIYRDAAGKVEEGTITSLNPWFVFVRYHDGCTSAATGAEYLEWSYPQR